MNGTVIRRSITLPKELDKFVVTKSKAIAKERGNQKPNYSAVLADFIIAEKNKAKSLEEAQPA
jgi:hypothetical protein